MDTEIGRHPARDGTEAVGKMSLQLGQRLGLKVYFNPWN